MNKKIILFMILSLVGLTSLEARIFFGVDVLEKQNFKSLKGARVSLITNHTGVSKNGKSTVQLLHENHNVTLVSIMTPEHGFRGLLGHGQAIGHGVDPETNLPVYSLYGENKRPTPDMLADVDTLVFDIQDVGTRFYTYAATMVMAMEVAAKQKLAFVVLDRPNPIRGDMMDGDVLDSDIKRLTGYFPLPVRHGLTIGEIAEWVNQTQSLGVNLRVVKLKKWKRDMWYDQTGYDFIAPSPNIKSLVSALLYSGIGCFEATNVSVGRGTEIPFELFGAPWIDGKKLSAYLRKYNFPGVTIDSTRFTPTKDLYAGKECGGVRLLVTNRQKVRPLEIFLAAFAYLYENYPDFFEPDWEEVRVVTGTSRLKETLEKGGTWEDVLAGINEDLLEFKKNIRMYYLY